MLTVTLTSSITSILFVFTSAMLALVCYEIYKKNKKITKQIHVEDGLKVPPTPRKLPIIGHLHLLGGYEVPYQAFSFLGKKYGNVVKLQLGQVKCVVVNDQKNIREALVTKGHHFDSRPNFQRYKELFSGNKENSLAFCDWSDTQKTRRDMLKAYTFPRAFSNKFASLETIISSGTRTLVSQITPGETVDLKPMVLNTLAHRIRDFIEDRVVEKRYQEFDLELNPNDYVDSLIKYVKSGDGPELPWNTALFALEDIVGGHSAVGNFLIKVFGFLVEQPEVQKKMQEEIDAVVGTEREVTIADRGSMPYTESVIFEAIRLIASPIVPRVANQDSSIDGYKIEQGTVLFLNNYDLSMSEKLWDRPEEFLPFGGGRRSCMGYKMVQLVSFGILGGFLQKYTILPVENESYKVPIGSLALAKDTFKFRFARR
nr:cytochrome P450 [Pharsalia antennata]